ncbi:MULTISPECIES: GNAT family N-acetyltransferase [Providencia]|uniref:GNAT family N-acetyltransferase n=1 Tax=Providencia TaxID=586 RepID=UPI0008389162|nr:MULTISPECIES: GNAT family N-acetyltransferase [Providencia]MBP6122727.1 GNAT family N-acetyltransferase [Providencia sp.]MDD9341721.1 GNAT family N-acetyltransferase [Providencia heimbachae]NIH22399.1 GNAT family N-acetyltransferase [Providencia heimbachae]QCJ69783.1 N-acetyltransferase [Providencia heimbachae]
MLTVKRLTKEDAEEINTINKLYDYAFPRYEQRSYAGRSAILSINDYHLDYFSDNGVFVGFIGSWKINDYFYIEHLAISSNLRGQGYGQKVLEQFCSKVMKVILEIDPVIDEVSQKRLSFYRHCGFKQNQYQHAHPSYYPENKPHYLEVLTFPSSIDQQTYQIFNQKLQTVVMALSLL